MWQISFEYADKRQLAFLSGRAQWLKFSGGGAGGSLHMRSLFLGQFTSGSRGDERHRLMDGFGSNRYNISEKR